MGSQPEGRREAIVRVATRLFVENGGQPTSLETVANAAGVTRTAVYYYFPSKSDLVQAVVDRLDWDWWLKVIEESRKSTHLFGRLRILLETLVEQSNAHSGSVYFALVDAARDDNEVRAGLRSQLKSVQSSIRGMIADCDDLSGIPGAPTLDDVVDGVLGLVWCVAAGVTTTRNVTVLAQVAKAIELVFPVPGRPEGNRDVRTTPARVRRSPVRR